MRKKEKNESYQEINKSQGNEKLKGRKIQKRGWGSIKNGEERKRRRNRQKLKKRE